MVRVSLASNNTFISNPRTHAVLGSIIPGLHPGGGSNVSGNKDCKKVGTFPHFT